MLRSNLGDAWATMLNKIGQSNEGIINDAIVGVTALIENYEEVGRTVLELVAVYGAYKAVLMTVTAINSAVTAVNYSAQAASLENLLSTEQKARLSKLGLSKTSAAYLAAVKAETQANVQAATVAAAKARADSEAAHFAIAAKRQEYFASMQLHRQRVAEMATAQMAGEIKQIEIAQRNLAAAATNKETSALAYQNASVDAKITRKIAEQAVTRANTLATNVNTASQIVNANASNFLALAKQRLAAAAAKLNAVLMSNIYVIAAAAVAALAYGIYKLATFQTSAEKAQRRLNEATEEFNVSVLSEERELERLRTKLARCEKGTDEYRKTKNEIISKFGQYNSNLETEIENVDTLANTYLNLSNAIRESFGERQYSKFIAGESENLDKALTENLKYIQKVIKKSVRDSKISDAEGDSLYDAIYDAMLKGLPDVEMLYTNRQGALDVLGEDMMNILDKIAGKGSLQDRQIQFQLNQMRLRQSEFAKIDADAKKMFGMGRPQKTEEPKGDALVIPTYKEAYEKAEKDWAEAKKILADITKDRNISVEKYNEAVANEKAAKEKYEALGGNTKTTKEKKKDYTEQLERDQQADINFYKTLQFQIDQAIIDAKKEGYEKVLKQNNLNYEKEKDQIRRQQNERLKQIQDAAKNEWLAANKGKTETDWFKSGKIPEKLSQKDTDMFDQQYAQAAAAKEAADKLAAEREKERINELIEKYGDYYQKRVMLAEKWEKKIATIPEFLRDAARAQGDDEIRDLSAHLDEYRDFVEKKEAIERDFQGKIQTAEQMGNKRLVAELRKDLKKSMSRLALESIEKSDAFERLFANIDKLTIEEIEKLISEIEQHSIELKAEFTESDLNAVKRMLKDARNEIASRNPFTALSVAMREFRKDSSVKNLKALMGAGNNLAENFGEITGSVLQMTSALSGVIGEDATEGLNDVLGNFQAAQKGAETWGGWWGAIIGGVTDLIPKIVKYSGYKTEAEKYAEAKEEYEAYVSVIDKVIETHLKLAETLAGKNANEAFDKAIELTETQIGAARKLGKEYLNSGASGGFLGIGSKASYGRRLVAGMSAEGWQEGANALGKTVNEFKSLMGGRMDTLFEMSAEQLRDLYERAPMFIAKLDAETRKYLEDIISGVESLAEIRDRTIKKHTLLDSNTLFDDFLNMLSEMDTASSDFSGNFEKYMQKAIINAMMQENFSEILAAWREKFSNAMGDEAGMEEHEYEVLKREYQKMYEGMFHKRDEMAKMFDWTVNDEREVSKKGFATMSQDSADELNGRFTAMQAMTYTIGENLKGMVQYSAETSSTVAGIRVGMEMLSANSRLIVQHLAGIESNTARLAAIEGYSSALKNGIDDINLKGVRIRE